MYDPFTLFLNVLFTLTLHYVLDQAVILPPRLNDCQPKMRWILKSSLRLCFHNLIIPCTGLLLTESHVLVDSVGRHQVVARVLSAPIAAGLREGVGVRAEIDKVDPMSCRGKGNEAK